MAPRSAPSTDRRAWARRAAGGATVAGAAALAFAAPPPAATGDLQAAVEAAYVYKLAPFAGWPPSTFSGPATPFVICIQGADPFRHRLDDAAAGQRVAGHAIVVAHLGRVDGASGCQLVYVGGSAAQPRAAALKALRGAHVLTVTDELRGAGPHGMIHFVPRGGRLRFEVDLRQADAAGVTISSKLLALAVTVVR